MFSNLPIDISPDCYKGIKDPQKQQSFFEEHRADVMIHKAAKTYFDERGMKKVPSINQLKEQWAALEKEKRPLYSKYKATSKKFKDLCTAKSNAARMLSANHSREVRRGHGQEI